MSHVRGSSRSRSVIACVLVAAVLVGWWLSAQQELEIQTPMAAQDRGSATVLTTTPPSRQAIAAPAVDGTLRGRVIDALTKSAVTNFRLELQRLPEIEGKQAPASKAFRVANGQFEWTGIRPDRWRLIVTAAGYQRFELDDVLIEADRVAAALLIPLRRGAVLTGRVYDQSNGQPIPRAKVTYREAHVARFSPDWRTRPVVATDDRGVFKIEGLPRGRVTLSVSAPEYAEREMDVVANDSLSVEVALSRGATIAGLLTASDGASVVAGTVDLMDLEYESAATIDTEPNGEFAFRRLSPGRYRLIGKTAQGRAEQELQIGSDERREGVVLRIESGGTIRGTLRGLRSQDFSRVNITVRRPNSGMTNSSNARVDSYGGYVLSGVEPSHMIITAVVGMRRQLSKRIDMPPNGELTVDFDFPPAVRLAGRVTRGGVPFASAELLPERASQSGEEDRLAPTTTDANGEYVLEELAQGEYVVRVGNYRSPVVRVQGDTFFDIDIPLKAHFAGRIVESEGDVPINGASVDIWTVDATASRARLQASSNDLGEFALSGLEPGELVVTVYKPGYELYRERLIYGSAISDRTIRLRQSRGVNVRVRDPRTGQAIRGVTATEISNGIVGLKLVLHLDDDGYSQLPSELAGSDIAFSAPGFFTIAIPRWNGRPVELKLPVEGPVRNK